MQRLCQRAWIGAQFVGEECPAAFVGQQRAGAVARFGLEAHQRLVGVFAHLVAGEQPPADGDGVGIVAGLGIEVGRLQEGIEEALTQPFAFGLQPVGIGVADQVVVLVEVDRAFQKIEAQPRISERVCLVQPALELLDIQPDVRVR